MSLPNTGYSSHSSQLLSQTACTNIYSNSNSNSPMKAPPINTFKAAVAHKLILFRVSKSKQEISHYGNIGSIPQLIYTSI